MSFPSAIASGESNFLNSSLSNTSLSPTIKGVSFGTSIPIALLPGIGASILILLAAKLNAISSVKFTILLTFTPGLGCISYLVIVGPTVTWFTLASTPKSARVFSSKEAFFNTFFLLLSSAFLSILFNKLTLGIL